MISRKTAVANEYRVRIEYQAREKAFCLFRPAVSLSFIFTISLLWEIFRLSNLAVWKLYHKSAPRGRLTNENTSDILFCVSPCGRNSMAEFQPSKLATRVRFPSPAPRRSDGIGRLGRLKICCTRVREGSSPSSGTSRAPFLFKLEEHLRHFFLFVVDAA